MDISLVSDIHISVTISGVEYVVTATPKSIRPKAKVKLAETFNENMSLVKEAIFFLGYGDDVVDTTHINGVISKDISSKHIGIALEHLGYDSVIRFKHTDKRNHYIRYNSLLITGEDALKTIKGQ